MSKTPAASCWPAKRPSSPGRPDSAPPGAGLAPAAYAGPPDLGVGLASYAAWLGGGLWLCRVRVRSGLVAVVVPSGLRRRSQPQRWIAIWWWNPQSGTRFGRAVGPPRDLGMMWWMSQTGAGWSQPGKARRGWAGMVSMAAPMSSGRLMVVSG